MLIFWLIIRCLVFLIMALYFVTAGFMIVMMIKELIQEKMGGKMCMCKNDISNEEYQNYVCSLEQRANNLENELAVVKSDRDIYQQAALDLTAICIKIKDSKSIEEVNEIIHNDMKILAEHCYTANHPMVEIFKRL